MRDICRWCFCGHKGSNDLSIICIHYIQTIWSCLKSMRIHLPGHTGVFEEFNFMVALDLLQPALLHSLSLNKLITHTLQRLIHINTHRPTTTANCTSEQQLQSFYYPCQQMASTLNKMKPEKRTFFHLSTASLLQRRSPWWQACCSLFLLT